VHLSAARYFKLDRRIVPESRFTKRDVFCSIGHRAVRVLIFLLVPPAPEVAFLSHLLVLVGKFLQLVIREMFNVNHLILRLMDMRKPAATEWKLGKCSASLNALLLLPNFGWPSLPTSSL
jgi:hypothetical protein